MFPKGQESSVNTDRVQRQLKNVPFLDGKQLSFNVAASGSAQVVHGLGRTPRGFIVTGVRNGAVVLGMNQADSEIVIFTNFLTTNGADVLVWIY